VRITITSPSGSGRIFVRSIQGCVVAEPNLFGESSETFGRENNHEKGAHGGNWFPP